MKRAVRLIAAGVPGREMDLLARELPRHLPVVPAVVRAPLELTAGRESFLLLEQVLRHAHEREGALCLAVAGSTLAGEAGGEVFGEATVGGPAAVVTAFGADGSPTARRRLLTSSVHELGHMLGLEHCDHPTCAMYPSRHLSDTDRKGPGICDRCTKTLRRNA